MNVLVDTSVWSLALRRNPPSRAPEVVELVELIREQRVEIIGPIRQEVLSGVRSGAQFRLLRDRLRAFPDLPLSHEDYEQAAEFFTTCRGRGVQGSNTDFLICAAAHRRGLAVFTTDNDFQMFQHHIPVRLHTPRPT